MAIADIIIATCCDEPVRVSRRYCYEAVGAASLSRQIERHRTREPGEDDKERMLAYRARWCSHKKLVVHGTGRVSGTIRYGTLVVTEGGDLTGDVKRLDASADPAQASSARMSN